MVRLARRAPSPSADAVKTKAAALLAVAFGTRAVLGQQGPLIDIEAARDFSDLVEGQLTHVIVLLLRDFDLLLLVHVVFR